MSGTYWHFIEPGRKETRGSDIYSLAPRLLAKGTIHPETEVIEKTAHQGGMNFVRGALNFSEDWQRICGGSSRCSLTRTRCGSSRT